MTVTRKVERWWYQIRWTLKEILQGIKRIAKCQVRKLEEGGALPLGLVDGVWADERQQTKMSQYFESTVERCWYH